MDKVLIVLLGLNVVMDVVLFVLDYKFFKQGCEKYEEMYGPLTHHAIVNGDYRWLDDPWPWEYAQNKEG